MTPRKRAAKPRPDPAAGVLHDVENVVAWLEQSGDAAVRKGMARYAIPSDSAFGIPVATLQREARRLGRSHELAAQLWQSGHYEARLLAAFVDEPARVTPAQMDRWTKDFDSWALCDTVCMHLYDRTPHAQRKVEQWSTRRGEFEKRAAFALLASLALHDKGADDSAFLTGLALVEAAAHDERNFVKKAVNWALRAIGLRNATLHAGAMKLASSLAASDDATARWIGKDAARQLAKPAALARLARARAPAKK
jgi:3-methyladenine DNA glycosylase AlkD